jgi:alpha-ketoglutarate-dependent taurine dioxygenase
LYGDADAKPPGIAALVLPLLRSRAFLLVCFLSFGCTIVRETFNTWTPVYLRDFLGYTPGGAASASGTAIAYNNRSIRAVRLPAAECVDFYAAYRRFAALLRDPGFQLRVLLEDGQLVVFDNRRILHGRTGFASAKHPRHLQGCYLTRDSVCSQTALLRAACEHGARP